MRKRRRFYQFKQRVHIVLYDKFFGVKPLAADLHPEADTADEQHLVFPQIVEGDVFSFGKRMILRQYDKELFLKIMLTEQIPFLRLFVKDDELIHAVAQSGKQFFIVRKLCRHRHFDEPFLNDGRQFTQRERSEGADGNGALTAVKRAISIPTWTRRANSNPRVS